MPTIRELAAPYGNFMLAPEPGPGVCRTCFNLTAGFDECYACTRSEHHLDAVAPISYSVAHEQLHHALAAYKRVNGDVGRRLALQLASVLWCYLDAHERCVARAVGASTFDVITTVPSRDADRDERHPLRWIVAEVVGLTRDRHERLLIRTQTPTKPHLYDPDKYETVRCLTGEAILLIDDTWTTGATAQSAARALKAAGAGPVAAVVIGRHVNREWHDNDRRLSTLPRPFDWTRCVFCSPACPPAG
jgi:predicted amidophosphoribosyltransferase